MSGSSLFGHELISMDVGIGEVGHESTSTNGLRGKRASRQLTFLLGVSASVGVSVGFTPFVPTHPHDEGVIKETRGFIGESELLRKGTDGERGFGWEIVVVGAKVGRGDGVKGESSQ